MGKEIHIRKDREKDCIMVVGYELRVIGCGLRVVGYELRVVS